MNLPSPTLRPSTEDSSSVGGEVPENRVDRPLSLRAGENSPLITSRSVSFSPPPPYISNLLLTCLPV